MDQVKGTTPPSQDNYKNKLFSPRYIVVYLVVAAIVYGLVFYLFIAKKGGYKQPSGTSSQSGLSQKASSNIGANVTTVTLTAENNSGEVGTAILSETGGKTKVLLFINNAPKGVGQPAHIHTGNCPGVGEVKYPLSNIVDGKSDTTLDVSLTQLKSQLPLAINVHKSQAEAKVYVSCGQLK